MVVLAVESLIIFLVALWFAEAISAARVAGAALVLIGMALTIAQPSGGLDSAGRLARLAPQFKEFRG